MTVHTHGDFSEPTRPFPILMSARKQQVSIFKVFGLTQPGFEPMSSRPEPAIFGFPNLPEQEVSALLIHPPQLVHSTKGSLHNTDKICIHTKTAL